MAPLDCYAGPPSTRFVAHGAHLLGAHAAASAVVQWRARCRRAGSRRIKRPLWNTSPRPRAGSADNRRCRRVPPRTRPPLWGVGSGGSKRPAGPPSWHRRRGCCRRAPQTTATTLSAGVTRRGRCVGEPPRRPISPPDDARRRVAVDDTTPPCGTTAGAARGDPGSRGFVLACSHACIATAARPTAVQRGIFCAAGLRGDGGGLRGPVGRHGAAARVVGAVGSGAGWRGSEHRGATRHESRRGGAAARGVSRLSWRIVCGPQAVVGGINSS